MMRQGAAFSAELTNSADVSVAGKDASFFSNILNPTLTTVRIPIYEAGRSAAELVPRQSTRVIEKAFQEEAAV